MFVLYRSRREEQAPPLPVAEIFRRGGGRIVDLDQTSVGTDVHGGPYRLVSAVRHGSSKAPTPTCLCKFIVTGGYKICPYGFAIIVGYM